MNRAASADTPPERAEEQSRREVSRPSPGEHEGRECRHRFVIGKFLWWTEKAKDAREKVVKREAQLDKARIDGRSKKTIFDLERKLKKDKVDADAREKIVKIHRPS